MDVPNRQDTFVKNDVILNWIEMITSIEQRWTWFILLIPYLCLLQTAFSNHPYMIDCKFERIGRTAQRGIKEGRSEIQNQLQNKENNFMAGNIKLTITSANSSGKRSREAEVAISRLIELTFLISQLSTRTWTYQNTKRKSTKIMSTSQCKISIYTHKRHYNCAVSNSILGSQWI